VDNELNSLEGIGRGHSKYFSGIFIDGLRRTKRNVTQNSQCPCRDINRANPEYIFSFLQLHQPAQHADTNACSSYGTIIFTVYILLRGLLNDADRNQTAQHRVIDDKRIVNCLE
jgi:hypothetical protein